VKEYFEVFCHLSSLFLFTQLPATPAYCPLHPKPYAFTRDLSLPETVPFSGVPILSILMTGGSNDGPWPNA
jgi:hypothetical protein